MIIDNELRSRLESVVAEMRQAGYMVKNSGHRISGSPILEWAAKLDLALKEAQDFTDLIDNTYDVELPNGERRKVNRLDYHLTAFSVDAAKAMGIPSSEWIQLEGGSWFYFENLKLIGQETEISVSG